MTTKSSIPFWKRVVDQKHYRNNLTCSDLDALADMLPSALRKLKFEEVDPDDFIMPEEYTPNDVELAINKVVCHLNLHEQVNKSNASRGKKHNRYNAPRRFSVIFRRFSDEEKATSVAYIHSGAHELIDIYFDLDRIEKRELAPASVMEVVIHEVCHEMLWTYGYKATKCYKDITERLTTEYLTEICIVYTGFGKIMSNSSQHAEQRGLDDPGYIDWWQVSYLRQKFFNASVPLRHTGLFAWFELDDLIVKCQWLKNFYGGSKVVVFRLLFIFITLCEIKHSEVLITNPTIQKVVAGICLFMFFPWKIKPMFGCLSPILLIIGMTHIWGKSGVLFNTPWHFPSLVSVSLIFLLLIWKMKVKLGNWGAIPLICLFVFLFGDEKSRNGILVNTPLMWPMLVVFLIFLWLFSKESENEEKS